MLSKGLNIVGFMVNNFPNSLINLNVAVTDFIGINTGNIGIARRLFFFGHRRNLFKARNNYKVQAHFDIAEVGGQ